ncbi:MAG: hypothetical protein AB1779_11575 [Candidatus Thermoplasmatota archaeon]
MKTLLDFGIQIKTSCNSFEHTLEKALAKKSLTQKQVEQLKKEHKKHVEHRKKNKFEGKCDKCDREARYFSSKFKLCDQCFENQDIKECERED